MTTTSAKSHRTKPEPEPVLKLFISPNFDNPDQGDGGIRRVVEAQKKYLPPLGFEIVDNLAAADICAYHAGTWMDPPAGQPVVSHCHGLYWNPEYDWESWAHDLNRHVIEAMRRADIVTAPSKWVAYALARGGMLDPTVLYHGVEVDDWQRSESNEVFVLWNKTRIDPVCSPAPVNDLARRATDVKFVTTFGESAGNVLVTGKLPYEHATSFVKKASVYLCTTRETFGIGTLEAMACQVPVLGWRWGGQAEIIEHEHDGYLALPGDFDDLERGLRYCLEHRERLGANARAKVLSNFTWQHAMEKYATVYRQLVRRRVKEATKPKVSVVVTCYNLANTLPRAIESVRSQENFDLSQAEIVIVNDNSPDDTATVAANLAAEPKAPKIRIVTNEKNLYLAGALNTGIMAANGKYIIPLDADNELGPRALDLLSSALDKGYLNPTTRRVERVDIAYGAMEVVDESGNKPNFISGWPTQFNYVEQMRHRNQIPSTSMYRRSVWLRCGGYRSRCRTAEDADFWCRATSFGAVPRRVTDAPTLVYHDRSDSMSHVEQDWDWTAWYTWARQPKLTPFMAAVDPAIRPNIYTYEPALVTVVIPVGPGHGTYVQDAVDSLVAQTFLNWRCVIINDSGAVLPPLPSFARIIETNGNIGPAAARNLGIETVNTPYFLPLDADDYLHPDALKVLVEYARRGDKKDYFYSDWIVQATGEVSQTPEFNCEELRQRLVHSVTALYPISAWRDVGGFDAGLDAWEDWDFILALIKAGYCGVRVPHGLFYYRMHTGQRREELYARRETLIENMKAKWPEYLVESKAMACGCGSRTRSAPHVNGSATAAPAVAGGSVGDMVMLEFKGTGGARTYRGSVTGTIYRFGADPSHKIRYVMTQDAKDLLKRPEFVQANVDANSSVVISNVVLDAKGPPVRA